MNISKYLGVLKDHPPEPPRSLLPPGFFAAVVMGDVSKIKDFLVPEAAKALEDEVVRDPPEVPPAPRPAPAQEPAP